MCSLSFVAGDVPQTLALMSPLETLVPKRHVSLDACLAQAGIEGKSATPSDWVHVDGDATAVVLWHSDMRVGADGLLAVGMNMRAFCRQLVRLKIQDDRTTLRRLNAQAVDAALKRAADRAMPVSAIIVSGSIQSIADPVGDDLSRITHRELDSIKWYIDYDDDTGHAVLTRGEPRRRFVDQHSFTEANLADRVQLERREAVRSYVRYRAAGRCEHCGIEGIVTADGIYLETHHVVPLSEGGLDETWNVVALCANDHRRVHVGLDRDDLRAALLLKLSPQRFAAAA